MHPDKTIVCLACYKDRLASVCENADEYKLFEIRDEKFYPAGLLSLPSKDPMDRTSAILACGVTYLLCGAICAQTRTQLENGGVAIVPWLTGCQDDVLHAFRNNALETLRMPGCHSPDTERRGLSNKDKTDSAI
ncbi:dinitrogenase iron-molybdenum cofactor biosynthesis protein [uncultured Pseudodesulfovibrio sp.]|uniref:dinitrogenase iron-molybdenum cofactor biosynthesis protein n=1 Tax=uncultured Pseudodesulfovibrio sp. TaxID=2035858 RepID=UPI0029C74CA1|nr:dinitrogenase iron-molybdenum cofactor biosynthesis protein [uncultured Pseudodesulfovibrio sp.]